MNFFHLRTFFPGYLFLLLASSAVCSCSNSGKIQNPPSNLSYAEMTGAYTCNLQITDNIPSITGTVTSWSADQALPEGLMLDPSTGTISGTPAEAQGAALYTITASNPYGSTSAQISIKIEDPALTENPGLRNDDGTIHVIPGAHGVTGRTITVSASGTGDQRPAIQAAITGANPGDEVYFTDGDYYLQSSWSGDAACNIKLKSGVNLRGQSRKGVRLITDFDVKTNTLKTYVLRGMAVRNIAISNLTITSTWTGSFSEDTNIANAARGGPNGGIAILNSSSTAAADASSEISISNVTVEKFYQYGVLLGFGCRDISVSDCTVQDATDVSSACGIGFALNGGGHSTASANPYLGLIQDTLFNRIQNCTAAGPNMRHGIYLQFWTHNNLVTGCTFTDTRLDAIDLHGEDEYKNEISLNTIEGKTIAPEGGIGIGNSGDTHDKSGPYNYIHDNTIISCVKGITCDYASDYQMITNNDISRCGAVLSDTVDWTGGCAIELGKTAYSVLSGNKIHDNTAADFKAIYLRCSGPMYEESGGCPAHCSFYGNTIIKNSANDIIRDSLIADSDWLTNIFK
jgi:hypothetical protein